MAAERISRNTGLSLRAALAALRDVAGWQRPLGAEKSSADLANS